MTMSLETLSGSEILKPGLKKMKHIYKEYLVVAENINIFPYKHGKSSLRKDYLHGYLYNRPVEWLSGQAIQKQELRNSCR
jgi:hypothetical protein